MAAVGSLPTVQTQPPSASLAPKARVYEATGGPCRYTGKSMLEAHTGMNITEDEFGIIAAHFAAAMANAEVGIGVDDNATIMGVLAAMHDDIVGGRGPHDGARRTRWLQSLV